MQVTLYETAKINLPLKMENEEIEYINHIFDFIGKISMSTIESIEYFKDEPTFNFLQIPFRFKYCLAENVISNR